MKKPSIPRVQPQNSMLVLEALKQNIETITGQRGGEIAQLSSTATLAQVIAKINTIITTLNASGN